MMNSKVLLLVGVLCIALVPGAARGGMFCTGYGGVFDSSTSISNGAVHGTFSGEVGVDVAAKISIVFGMMYFTGISDSTYLYGSVRMGLSPAGSTTIMGLCGGLNHSIQRFEEYPVLQIGAFMDMPFTDMLAITGEVGYLLLNGPVLDYGGLYARIGIVFAKVMR